jgi:hypothetical protein
MMRSVSGWQLSRRIPGRRYRFSWGLVGVLLRWLYGIVVDVVKGGPWDFGNWSTIIARLVIALISTIFVFSGYWGKVKDQPASMRFLNSLVYGFSIDALVGPWMY